MAHSSDDTEDSHMGHSSKPLYITNEASFNEEEKEAIECLAHLKHKPVVYDRSKSRKEDAHNADHAQVQANISSGPPQTANHNARLSKIQVEVPSSFPVETEYYIGGISDWRRFAKQLKDKDESEVELFRGIRRDDVHKEIDNDDANPKTGVSNEGADININGKRVGSKTNRNDKCVRGTPRRKDQPIGVSDYQRSGRYEANIWLKKERRQIHLGRYFIVEAAARCSDKAMLVTRLSPEWNLNYCAEDYDMKLIQEWRQVFNEDVSEFAEILRGQSKKFSEGCVKGLNDEAASKLLQLIEEKKKVEADAIDV